MNLSNAQRGHGEAMRNAERGHKERAAVRAQREQQIREWREGLAASHAEYEEWYATRRAPGQSIPSAYAVEPNIVSAVWFQSQRRHLSLGGSAARYRGLADIQCDSDVADVLGNEIARIEREWLDQAE